jgi:hypothetical protein
MPRGSTLRLHGGGFASDPIGCRGRGDSRLTPRTRDRGTNVPRLWGDQGTKVRERAHALASLPDVRPSAAGPGAR